MLHFCVSHCKSIYSKFSAIFELNSHFHILGSQTTTLWHLHKEESYRKKVFKMEDQAVRVLSIQSHVVSGYAGNKSACFPLQVLGFEVDPINSVQFSNHTAYDIMKGQVLNASELDDLILGLQQNRIDFYSHLLTGYIGSKSFLEAVKNAVCKLRTVNPNLIYVCDPVLGDNGKMYVPQELLPMYTNEIIGMADIVTPNQFEAELITGKKITSFEDVPAVLEWFHEKGVRIAVISSTDLGNEEELIGFASSITADKGRTQFLIKMPKLPANFTGTGDLFTSLMMAWLHRTQNNLKSSLENTVSTMQKVTQRTLAYANEHRESSGKVKAKNMELKLVQSLDDIRSPNVTIFASPF